MNQSILVMQQLLLHTASKLNAIECNRKMFWCNILCIIFSSLSLPTFNSECKHDFLCLNSVDLVPSWRCHRIWCRKHCLGVLLWHYLHIVKLEMFRNHYQNQMPWKSLNSSIFIQTQFWVPSLNHRGPIVCADCVLLCVFCPQSDCEFCVCKKTRLWMCTWVRSHSNSYVCVRGVYRVSG